MTYNINPRMNMVTQTCMLSRLPAGPDSTFDNTQSLNAVVNMIQDEQLEHLPILTTDIQEATKMITP